MKTLLCTLALATLGLTLPGCVRSVGVYDDHPRDVYSYHTNPYSYDYTKPYYRSYNRPYYPVYRRPVVVEEHRHHDHDGIRVDLHASDW